MRTNIVIDDNLMKRAMTVCNLKTKKDIVHTALEEFVASRERRDISQLRGEIQFADRL